MKINFLKYRLFYFFISSLIIVPGVFSLLRFGLNPSVDFTGGSVLELKTSPIDQDKLKSIISSDYSTVQIVSKDDLYIVKLPTISQEQLTTLKAKLSEKFETIEEISFTTIGPSIGKELLTKTLTALSLAILVILLYIAYAFKNLKFGIAAILAMLHDTLVLLGSFSLLGHFFGVQTDPLFVTAMLTTLSFSVHDTIVVFDRIRELSRKERNLPFVDLANQAINETMTRSINNSLTIIFMLASLSLLGGDTIRWFAVALLIGSVSGTYSSPFTAIPILTLLHQEKKR